MFKNISYCYPFFFLYKNKRTETDRCGVDYLLVHEKCVEVGVEEIKQMIPHEDEARSHEFDDRS